MPTLNNMHNNYHGLRAKSQENIYKSAAVAFFVVSLATIITITPLTYAKDECAELDGLDDRIECYENKKEDKQEEYESVSKQLEDIRDQKDDIAQKITQLSSQLTVTQSEIDELSAEITKLEQKLEVINKNLSDRKSTLAEKIKLRNTVIRNYSKRGHLSELEIFFGVNGEYSDLNGFQYSALSYIFDKSINDEALRWIEILNSEINQYEADKKEALDLKGELEDSQNSLLALKNQLSQQKTLAQGEEAVLSEEESEKQEELLSLEEEIAKLSEKQQSILREKYGEGTISGYEAAEYKLPDPPFKPAYAAMSYGAFTHYKGMSQYGAKGRADDGKDYEDILKFYYDKSVKEKDDFPGDLCVEGYGDMDFQKYLYGIAEMPSDWPMDALKAQAIAARSFAYRYEKQGKCICTSQSCQVFLKSKSDNPPSRWKEAVDKTEDEIIEDVTTYYSATTGGYIENIGWDLDGDKWPQDAYEKKAKSPWFYKAWYTQSYTDNSSTCGRSTPWLDEEEMADVLNAWRVWRSGSGDEKDHISPVTTSCWGGDPYSHSEMAEKADKYGDKYSKVYSISVDISNSGYTSKVRIETDKGSLEIEGQEFKTVFNLRAPAYVALRSRLFDVEVER